MTRYYSDLTTREAVRRQLQQADATSQYTSISASYIDEAIHQISAYIGRYCNREFVPYNKTITVYELSDQWQLIASPGLYKIPLTRIDALDVLSLSSVTLEGTALNSAWYRLASYDGNAPYSEIHFDVNNVQFPSEWAFDSSLVLVGTFGFNRNPDNMYTQVETGVTIADATTTTLTVADSTAYEIWQYIKLEDELMQVTALPTSTTLTVKRGVNGTTASAHTGVAVSRYNIEPDIQMACTRLVAWSWNNRDDLGTTLTLPDGGVVRNNMPAWVSQTLSQYRALSWYST